MSSLLNLSRLARPRSAVVLLLATVGIVAAALVGVALARTFTLSVAKNATVTNANTGKSVRANIVVNGRGFAIYDLTGDSQRHPECTKGNGCFQFWPPVTVSSARKLSKAAGISGKLGTWHRNGFFQVTLGGHPLYRFAPDGRAHDATGEALRSFGGTWHVIRTATSKSSPMTTTTTTSTSSTMCLYCY
jgi:predicted lipoprotein with Yx(FWY)xxD motif